MRVLSWLISVAVFSVPALAEEPLVAIDWLRNPAPINLTQPLITALPDTAEPQGLDLPEVSVAPLEAPRSDTVGLLPSSTTGLPSELWAASQSSALSALFARISSDPLPALQALYYTLLLAEAEAPQGSKSDTQFLSDRVASLRRMGAVEPALALIERADPVRPALFDSWFDLTLLNGSEDPACAALGSNPALSQKYDTRIFCAARRGDWQTAALTFETASALGLLDNTTQALLAHYLDPETIDPDGTIPQGRGMSPLAFRLFEAAGTPLPTRNLQRAYAVADLRGLSGWKAEIEAAERLAHTGALPANRLLGLYTLQRAAASGGVWDRVSGVQTLEEALALDDPEAVGATLIKVYPAMRREGLAVVFATLYAEALSKVNLTGRARGMAYHLALMSPEYESLGAKFTPSSRADRFLLSLTKGVPNPDLATTTAQIAIAEAFAAAGPSRDYSGLLESGKLGQAILNATLRLDAAGPNQAVDIKAGLSTLRAVGLEDTARQAALQLLLLKARP